MRRRAISLAVVATVGALAVGCGGTASLDEMSADSKPYYWLGKSFQGLPLTHAEPYVGGRASFVYGDCEAKSDMGCAPPLEVQNVVCESGGAGVTIYSSTALADRAEHALRPLNDAAREAGTPLVIAEGSTTRC
jgi:hypothetical protein